MGSGVHAQAGGASAEAVSLGSELPAVAGFAVKDVLVHVGIGGIQHLVAHTAFVALLVEGDVAHHSGLSMVDGLAALWALGVFGSLEGHGCGGGGGRPLCGQHYRLISSCSFLLRWTLPLDSSPSHD